MMDYNLVATPAFSLSRRGLPVIDMITCHADNIPLAAMPGFASLGHAAVCAEPSRVLSGGMASTSFAFRYVRHRF